MDLKKFISESLTQIIASIQEAQENMNEFHAKSDSPYDAPYINPSPPTEHHKKLNEIAYDVAVTVSEGTSAEGGGGLSVMGISIGGKEGSEQMSSSVSRIKFSIPVSYPFAYKKTK